MVLFKCDHEGCEALAEHLVPVVRASHTSYSNLWMTDDKPEGWSHSPRSGVSLMHYPNSDSSTFCPKHADVR